jgi:hypothetical protein
VNEIQNIAVERIPPAEPGGRYRFKATIEIARPRKNVTGTVVVSASELYSVTRFSRVFLERTGFLFKLVSRPQ